MHTASAIDEGRLQDLLSTMVSELGAAATGALIVVGDSLGLYKSLAAQGPPTSTELAARTGTTERCVR